MTMYSLMGILYDAQEELETYVNQQMKTGAMNVQVSFIPVRPDQVEGALTHKYYVASQSALGAPASRTE